MSSKSHSDIKVGPGSSYLIFKIVGYGRDSKEQSEILSELMAEYLELFKASLELNVDIWKVGKLNDRGEIGGVMHQNVLQAVERLIKGFDKLMPKSHDGLEQVSKKLDSVIIGIAEAKGMVEKANSTSRFIGILDKMLKELQQLKKDFSSDKEIVAKLAEQEVKMPKNLPPLTAINNIRCEVAGKSDAVTESDLNELI